MTDRRVPLVRRLIEAHEPADAVEAAHLARIIRLLEAHDHPFDRNAFDPGHLTASGFVVDPSQTRMLLIHHRRLGIWIQPGGHIDLTDADPEAAARREISEETGATGLELVGSGLLDVDVHHYPARQGGDPGHEHFDLRFGFLAASTDLNPNEEVHDARWVSDGEIAGLELDESVLRPAGKLLRAP